MSSIPGTLLVVGAGVIGIEYASIFAALGTRVTVVERNPRLLEFCDVQIIEALQYHLRDLGLVLRLGETVTSVEKHDGKTLTTLNSGKKVVADTVMYSAGRQGATADIGLENVGLTADKRGRVPVDEHYRTPVENIYAVGDVIGFPSLASASFEQGRLASAHAFGMETRPMRDLLPIGIYTIPEISFAGRTEEELTAKEIPYEIGISRYRELARGQILGDSSGILKLLVSSEDRTLLGVHVFGTAATELVHIGQTVMGLGGTVDYLIDQVFNYPTLAESYKVAALDATNKLQALGRMGQPPPVTVADA
jgi:NAD(P) transhydrogenase